MIVNVNKSAVVLVATDHSGGGGGGCPTLKAADSSARIRDDYYGRVAIGKGLLKKVF
jgi:hypothetical protein